MNLKMNITIMIVSAVLLISACSKTESEKTTDKIINVETTIINEKEMSIPIHSSGKLYSKSELKLSFKTGGIIKQIYVDEGQTVRSGQVLAQLDLSEIQAQVYQSQLALEKAKREHYRVKSLFNDSVATLEQFQNTLTALDFARSNYEIAQFNLKYSRITAPSNGKILKKLAEQNEITGPGYPVVLFGSTEDEWIIRINLTDKDIFKVNIDDKAEIKFDAYPDKILYAFVSEIGKSADPYTGTYEVELKLTKPNIELASGLIAYANVFPAKTEKLAFVPIEAIVEGNDNEIYLYTLSENNQAEKIKVNVHKITDDNIIVKSGSLNGLTIITSSIGYISEGDIVNPENNMYVSESRKMNQE